MLIFYNHKAGLNNAVVYNGWANAHIETNLNHQILIAIKLVGNGKERV